MGMGHLSGHMVRASCEPLLLLRQCKHRTAVLYLEWAIREEDVAVAGRSKPPCLSDRIPPMAHPVAEAVEGPEEAITH